MSQPWPYKNTTFSVMTSAGTPRNSAARTAGMQCSDQHPGSLQDGRREESHFLYDKVMMQASPTLDAMLDLLATVFWEFDWSWTAWTRSSWPRCICRLGWA